MLRRLVDERTVMTADEVRRAIHRLAGDIVERHGGTDGLVLIGIQRRGAILAHRLAAAIGGPPVGTLDISLYRDDLTELATYPIVRPTELPFDISGTTVILVDDVLFTGRTDRAALDALPDHGRPRLVRLAV
ncbi:MAG: phosphoribosyltransferase family protein, partial [Chloroflexota bacterium]